MLDLTIFGTEKPTKPEKDNTEDLEIVDGVDTRSFIELNLYDYGDNINDPYINKGRADYLGFQQAGGQIPKTNLSLYSFNFGDNITSDLMAGQYVVTGTPKTGSSDPALINSTYKGTYGTTNLPISLQDDSSNSGSCTHRKVMKWTLDSEGYPMSDEGDVSYKYLFSEEKLNGVQYAQKMNKDSLTNFFKYDPTTGIYSYNSRINHAQFNAEDDTFTLYKQKISSNFMMYPFGNFLPFNDIVHQCKKSSQINSPYIQAIANSAAYKSTTEDSKYENLFMDSTNAASGKTEPYKYLSNVLDSFLATARLTYGASSGFGKDDNWTAYDCLKRYFDRVSAIPAGDSLPNDLLEDIYTIDYDEPTDFFFGIEMKMDFIQSRNGINTKGKSTILKFTGDDDVLFYIDGILFLDLSGIHRHVGGEIDFKNGEVRYYALDLQEGDVDVENRNNAVLIESFKDIINRAKQEAGDKAVAALGAGATEEQKEQARTNAEKLYDIPLKKEGDKYTTFLDYSSHKLNWYYMERGSGSGVCRIEFNLEQVMPSGIFKVNQYGEPVPGAGFAVYKAKEVNNEFKYLLPGNVMKTSADIKSVDENTGLITFNDNTTMEASYRGYTEADGSMLFTKAGGETMSLNEMRTYFGENFILREIKVPPGYRLVAEESWMAFTENTLYCKNTLDSGTWAAPNVTVMATEEIHKASNENQVMPYYTRIDGSGDVDTNTINGTLFAVVMRKCDEGESANNIENWHPVIGSDFTGYSVMSEGGIAKAIEAAKTYKDSTTNEYTHVFKVGQMYLPENPDNPVQIGMIATVDELPGEPELYYDNIRAQYVKEHTVINSLGEVVSTCTSEEADAYALANAKYAIAYFHTESSLDQATPDNTIRISPRYTGNSLQSANFRNFQMQWSAEVQVPNVVNSLYFQKTDIAGNLIDDAVFGLYNAVKGNEERGDGYYKADLVGNTQYYVRLDTNNNDSDQDAKIYDSNFNAIAETGFGEYTIGTSTPDLVDGVEKGLLTDVTPGIITVTEAGVTVTLTPATNASGTSMLGTTHDSCDTVDSAGTGHFSHLEYNLSDREEGRYFLKELYAPAGYMLSRENVKVVVLPNAVYANAGTADDHISVGNGPGYLVKTLDNFATKGEVADSLCWTYGVLRVDNSMDFGDRVFLKDPDHSYYAVDDIPDDGVGYISTGLTLTSNGDPYSGTEAMVVYYEYAGKEQPSGLHTRLFDYKKNDRSEWNNVPNAGTDTAKPAAKGDIILWSKQGWSDLSIYQDYKYGSKVTQLYPNSSYTNMGSKDIVNLFSSSTFVRVGDDAITRLQLVKEDGVTPDIKLQGAEFVLKMTGDGKNIWTSTDELYYDDAKGIFRLMRADETIDSFALKSDENGIVSLSASLAPGNYTLVETKAPAGYNKLSYDIDINVSIVNNKLSLTAETSDNHNQLEVIGTPEGDPTFFTVHVQNYSGYELPDTGGSGVYVFYAGGGLLLLTFVIFCAYIFLKKRNKTESAM